MPLPPWIPIRDEIAKSKIRDLIYNRAFPLSRQTGQEKSLSVLHEGPRARGTGEMKC